MGFPKFRAASDLGLKIQVLTATEYRTRSKNRSLRERRVLLTLGFLLRTRNLLFDLLTKFALYFLRRLCSTAFCALMLRGACRMQQGGGRRDISRYVLKIDDTAIDVLDDNSLALA